MATRKKVRRQSSLENLLSLFRRKPKQKVAQTTRPRSGSVDLPVQKSSVTPDVPVVKVERHHSDITPRPKLAPLRNVRAAQFTTKLPGQRDQNIRLRALGEASMSGFLEHKQVTRWITLWGVVCDHTLYGFKSEDPDEEQILLVNLEDCSLVQSSKSIFRLCQFNAHSLYFRANEDMQQWISALEKMTNSKNSCVTSPKINSLALITHPLTRSPSRSPNGMVKSLNLHASPRDPRRAIPKETDEGITFTAKSWDPEKMSFTEKFTKRESRHDVTLQEVWRSQNDVIKPDKEEEEEGAIIMHMEPVSSNSQSLDVRRRSLSAGSLPLPLVEHLRQSAHDASALLPRRRRPRCPVEVAASEIDPKTRVGWLLVEDEDHWMSSWCILSERILFIYENPDSTKAFDCLSLQGWSLTSRLQDHSMALHHQDFHAVNMKAKRQSDLEQWEAQLRTATQRVSIEGLNLERGNSSEFDDQDRLNAATVASQREWQQEFVQLRKQKLLQEVLQQKQRIERQQRQQQGTPTSIPEIQVSPLSGSDQELRYHGDKNIVALVRLKQRKVSTQLKVDGIHRTLHGRPNQKKPKKRGFLSKLSGDGGSSDESLNEFNVTNDDKQGLQLQLRDLHRQLEDINNTILIKQSERLQLGDDRLKSRSTSHLTRVGRDSGGSVDASSEESSERGSTESVHKLLKAQQAKKMAIPELIDFRQKLKIVEAPPNLRHSWSPSAFENFKISKGERKLDRQSPMTCSQEFVPPLPPEKRALGPKQKSLTSLSPRFPSPDAENNRNKVRISDGALAKIAAFEELLQENMII